MTKLKGDFTALVYSSYLGGSGSSTDIGYGIALDGVNPPNAYVTGSTSSSNFPLANPLQLNAYPPASHAFVTEVNGTGSALTYSTYLEGLGTDQGRGIAADSTGNAYIIGSTTSPNFPVLSSLGVSASPFQSSLGSSTGNAIVAKISTATAPSSLNFVPPVYNFHNVGVGPGINNTGGFGTEYFTLSNNTASSVTLGSPNAFNLTGPNNGDFSIQTGGTCTSGLVLAAGASCLVLVRFTPMDQDLRTAQLTINSTPPSSTVLNLSGFGAVPEINLSTNSINFGTNVPLNIGALSSVQITNTGGATLNVGSVQITGANASAFTLTVNSCTSVAVNSSCFIEVTFTPTAAQAYSANLIINDNAAGSPQTVSLSGTGVAQVVVSPLAHEYSGWIIGTASPDQDFFLNNGSGGSITLTSVTPDGGTTQSDFTNDPNSTTCTNGMVLPAGTGCNVEVYFKPDASGPTDTVDGRTGTFTFNWTGTLTSSQQVTVMGAAETGVTLYVNSVTAASEYVGVTESTAGGDIIYNGTSNPITVTSVTLSGVNPQDWTVQLGFSPTGNDCSADGIVPANSYCYLAGSFTPSAVGVRSAIATINYTGIGVPVNSSLTLSLTGTGIPGPVSFQSFLPFGSQIVGLTSPTHRVLLENTQKTPLAISSVSTPSGANGSDFSILSSSTCASSITVKGGGNCYLDLNFTPGATGSRTATITVTDNGPGSPRTLTLTGTGVTGSDQISVSPTVVDFGNVPLVGAGLTQPTLTGAFYLTNGGNSNTTITTSTASPNPALLTTPSPFALLTGVGSSCAPTPTVAPIMTTVLPQGGTCSVEVTFKPTATGEVSNTVTLTDSAGGLHTVTIQGNGVNQGAISATGMTITQLPGTMSTPQAITVTSTGSGPMTITSLAFNEGNGSNFALVSTGTTCTIGTVIPPSPGPGNTCVVMVTFTAPSATGSTGARLTVNANLGNGVSGSSSATVTGTVVSGGFTVAPTPPLNFGTVALGTTIDYSQVFNGYGSISITNNNPGSVTITKVAPQTGTDFAITNNSCLTTLAANNACYFDVTFTPSTNAAETNNIQVTYTGANSASSPFNIAVKGTGSNAVVATPNPLSVSTTTGGGSSPTITIGNGSTSTVTITGTTAITPSGSPFSLSFNTCSTLTATGTPGNSCQIYINFDPTIPGPYTASFNVNYTVGSNPTVNSLQVNLNGTGTAPVATVTPNPVIFPGQNVNTQSQVINVVVQNTGNDYLSFSNLPTITGPNANDFALAAGNYNTNCQYAYLQAGQSCVIPLNFTPSQLTNGSSRSATLTITDNSYPNKTQTVTLEGTANAGTVFIETTNLTFPQTNVGSTVTEGVLLSNTTNAGVVFNGVTYSTSAPPSGPYSTVSGVNGCVTGKAVSAYTGTCVIYIQFSPTGLTNPSTATVHYGTSGTIAISLSGPGSNPTVYASPNPLTFTSTRINTSSAQGTVALTNGTSSAASVTATVTTASISGTNSSDFSVVSAGTTCTNGFTLTALGGSCNVIVIFSPTPGSLGTRTATLTIFASDATHVVTLSGTAIGPNASVPTTLAFGNQATNQTSTMSLTVSNNGTDTLHLAASGAFAITSGADSSFFGIGTSAQGTTCSNGLAIGANSSCTIIVTFSPTTVRSYGPVTLTVTDDSGAIVGSTQQVSLSGNGVAPAIIASPSPALFGSLRVGVASTPAMTVTVTNTGGLAATLTAAPVTFSGTNPTDFSVASGTTCVANFVLAASPGPGNSCVVNLTFTPGGTGPRSATLNINDSASGSPQTVTLTGTGIFPQATPTPSPVAFGNQRQNATSGVQVLTLTNGGTDTLHLTTVALGGTNASDFVVATGTTCTNGSTVAAGATCIVNLTFTPPALGARSATITFTDDASPTTQVVNLTGTGVFPQATPTPSPVAFGNQRLNTASAAQTLTLTNGGTGTLNLTTVALGGTNVGDFAIATGTTCTNGSQVVAGASCVVKLTFTPSLSGARSATITFTDDASPTTQVVNLTGTGVFPQASPTPATVPFGNQTGLTTSAPQTVTLTNGGNGTLNLTTVALGGTNPTAFAIAAGTTCTNGGTVAAGASCVVNVTFTPSGLTPFSATLTFTDDANPTTQVVNLTGTGVTSTVNFNPSTVPFGNQRQSTTSAQQTTVLTNSGSTTLTITSVTLTGSNPGDFALATPASGTDCRTVGTVAAGATCTIAATFTPTALGSRSATVSVADSVTGSPHTAALTGTGTFPQATPTPSPVAFSNQIISTTSAAQVLTLTNGGTDTLHLTTVALGGTNVSDFAIATGTTCTNGSTLAAAGTCIVNLTFTPGAAGNRTATITFTDDASPTTQVVNLSGTGVTPPTATLSANSINFNTQRANTTSTAQNVTITNNGGAPLNITSITITGTNASDFAFSTTATPCPTSVSGQVAPGAFCTLSVTFAPAAINARTASIIITVTGIANPAPITLSGTGIAPSVQLAPTTAPFGNQEVSTPSAAQNGTLTNNGTDVLHITAVAITGTNASDFLIVATGTSCAAGLPTAVTVAATANCTWSVKFTPTALGARTASLTFTDDSGAVAGSTQSVALTGTGTAPVVQLAPTTVTFPATPIGQPSAAQNGTLTNTGTTALHLATVTITGTNAGDYALAAPAGGTDCRTVGTVAANASCNWSVTFIPTANGTRAATLTFTDDNNGVTGSTQTVALSGVTPPAATLSPSTPIAFSAQGVGTASNASTITLTNPGGSTLHITTVASPAGTNSGDFAIATGSTCTNGSTVVPSATCTINVTFTPAAAGARGPASIVITDDAGGVAGTTQSISLSGTGISYTLNIQTAPPPTAAGQPIMATIQLTPGTGGFPNTITFSATGLPPNSTGMFNPATLTPPITGPITSVFMLTTMARGGSIPRPNHPMGPLSGGWIATAILSLLAMLTLRRGFRMQRFAYLPLAVLLLSAAIITGCATASGTPAGSYTVTITATSGSYTQTATVPVTVQ